MEVHPNGRTFRFDSAGELVPEATCVNPQLLIGLGAHGETNERLLGLICVHPVLPMPVHGSPLVAALLARSDVPWRARFTHTLDTLWTLRQLYTLCITGVLPGPPNKEGRATHVPPQQLHELQRAFRQQVGDRQERLYDRLDALYEKYAEERRALDADERVEARKRALNRFIVLLEEHTLGHIHDLEKLLYLAVLGDRRVALKDVITPAHPPVVAEQVTDRAQLERSVEQFFRTKVAVINADLLRNDPGYQPKEFIRVNRTPPLWRGCLSRDTLWDYFLSLDFKERLGKKEQN